jgi:hypothetical protein
VQSLKAEEKLRERAEEDGKGRDEEIQLEEPIQPANTEVILF